MVKEGYKETEIGVIPENWDVLPLKKLTENIGDIDHWMPKSTIMGIPYVMTGDLNENGTINFSKSKFISYEDYLKLSKKIKTEYGDIILARYATIGKTAFVNVDKKIVVSYSCATLKFKNYTTSKFIYYFLNTKNAKDQFENAINSGTQKNIGIKTIENFKVPIACEKETICIVEALSDMDNLISSLEKLIEKKKAIKLGIMQELFTGKKRLPGCSEKWDIFSLSDVGVISGSGVDKKILPDEQPITLLNYTNVYHQISIYRNDLNQRVTASLEKIKNCSVIKGDVFLTPTSETPEEIAISAVAMEDMSDVVYSYHVVRLRPNKGFNGSFINYALSTPQLREQAVQFAEGSGIRYVITLKKFREMKLYIPVDKSEQDAIAELLFDMDSEITALEQKLIKCQKLKQGMMQQLLTGKIRLVSNDDVVKDKPDVDALKISPKGHNHQFDDAVVIAGIVDKFYSDKYPLGRKKVQKLLYLFRRHQEADTSAFKKKAAGPYADEVRYKGGEPIAISSKYIYVKRGTKGSSFLKGEKIADALTYIENWNLNDGLKWLCEQFKYIKTDKLELLATIDMAMCDLTDAGITVTVDSIKELIKSHSEWKEKLSKSYFKDCDIAWAIKECKRLFN